METSIYLHNMIDTYEHWDHSGKPTYYRFGRRLQKENMDSVQQECLILYSNGSWLSEALIFFHCF